MENWTFSALLEKSLLSQFYFTIFESTLIFTNHDYRYFQNFCIFKANEKRKLRRNQSLKKSFRKMADAVKEVHLRPKKTQTPRNALSRALSGRRATQIGAELGKVTHKMSIISIFSQTFWHVIGPKFEKIHISHSSDKWPTSKHLLYCIHFALKSAKKKF